MIKFFIINFFNPSSRLIRLYKIGKKINNFKGTLPRLCLIILRYIMVKKWSCDISFNSEIENNVFFPHPIGIVIGDGVKIKKNVIIYQNVTLGAKSRLNMDLSYPTIQENVIIYPNSVIIGSIVIGKNSVIGAGSLVNKDFPSGSVITGINTS